MWSTIAALVFIVQGHRGIAILQSYFFVVVVLLFSDMGQLVSDFIFIIVYIVELENAPCIFDH